MLNGFSIAEACKKKTLAPGSNKGLVFPYRNNSLQAVPKTIRKPDSTISCVTDCNPLQYLAFRCIRQAKTCLHCKIALSRNTSPHGALTPGLFTGQKGDPITGMRVTGKGRRFKR